MKIYWWIHAFGFLLQGDDFLHEHTNVNTYKTMGFNDWEFFLHSPKLSPHISALFLRKQLSIERIDAHQIKKLFLFIKFDWWSEVFVNSFELPLEILFEVLSQIFIDSNSTQWIARLFKTFVKCDLSDCFHALFW